MTTQEYQEDEINFLLEKYHVCMYRSNPFAGRHCERSNIFVVNFLTTAKFHMVNEFDCYILSYMV